MRISASTTVLTLAMYLGAAAAWEGFGSRAWIDPSDLEGIEAAHNGDSKSRCDEETTRLNNVWQKRIPGELRDGCGANWPSLDGTARFRGTYGAPIADGLNDLPTTCDKNKVTFKGTGKENDITAALSSTETSYGEETVFAYSEVNDAKVRATNYNSPYKIVFNYFYDTTAPAFANKGEGYVESYTCSNGAKSGPSGINFGVDIRNPTDTVYRNLKATFTFASPIELVKFSLPKGSPRVALPSIGTNRDAPGARVNVTKLDLPLASRTLPSGGSTSVFYSALDFAGLPVYTLLVNVTITNGRDTVCTEVLNFTPPPPDTPPTPPDENQ